jgi:LysR family nitrogen assimilation transcriptional regulator
MNLRQLEIFIAIVEEGSLTRAAERVHIVQPALTQQIKVLEDEFGVPLLLRSSRGVRPTEAGKRLVKEAHLLAEQFASLRAKVVGTDAPPSGEVRVGVPATISALVSPRLIALAAATYPEVRVHIVEPMAGVLTDWLEQGKVDFAISYRAAHPRGVDFDKILVEPLELCYCPAAGQELPPLDAGAIAFEQTCGLPLIVPHRGYVTREIVETQARQLGVELKVSIEIDSIGPTKTLVEQGFGFAFLPPMATIAEREQGRLLSRRVAAPELERSVYLAAFQSKPMSSTASLVRELCRTVLHDLVQDGTWDARLEPGA